MVSSVQHVFAASFLSLCLFQAEAYPTWSGCPDLQNSDFTRTELVSKTNDPSLSEPVKFAFDMDASGNVDVYYVERTGGVKRYSGATKAITQLAKITASGGPEDGVTGIALDPGFKTNRWAYIYYSVPAEFRVSRYVVDGDILSQEKVVLKIPHNRGQWHSGGAMKFDDYGDLWITVGEHDGGATGKVPSTNDMRGCILRIHPTAEGAYTIPQGNFFPEGTENTRPEIYVMGTRNAYSIALDPVRRWLAWGDVGPDVTQSGKGTEEYNLVKKPGFMGWPYFAGENQVMPDFVGQNPAAPTNNNAGNTGLKTLPPAIPPIYPYRRNAAITGPIFRYDGDLVSSVKFPPHFHRKWLVSDFNTNSIKSFTLDEAGEKVTGEETILGNITLYRPLDFQQGPDGALYVLNYAGWYGTAATTSIIRIAYTGTCRPAEPKLEKATTGIGRGGSSPRSLPGVRWDASGIFLDRNGKHQVGLYEPGGRQVADWSGEGSRRYPIPEAQRGKMLYLRVDTPDGESVQLLPLPAR